jgi:hypothetical protein
VTPVVSTARLARERSVGLKPDRRDERDAPNDGAARRRGAGHLEEYLGDGAGFEDRQFLVRRQRVERVAGHVCAVGLSVTPSIRPFAQTEIDMR